MESWVPDEISGSRATLILQPTTGPPLRCGLDQRLDLGQGLSWLGAPLLGDVSIEQVFPERTVATKVYHHGLPAAPRIDDELDAWHFLE